MIRTSGLAALLALFGLAGVLSAEEARGVIKEYDPTRKQLVIEPRAGRGVAASFVVADGAQVTIGLRDGKLTDLVAGKRVRLTFEMRDGKPTVTAIHVIDILGTLQSLPGIVGPSPPVPGAPAPPAPVAPAPLPIPANGELATGTLRRVAATEREIILATPDGGREKYLVLRVPADAQIMRDGKPIALSDLKEAEAATVRMTSMDGKPTALSIQVGKLPEGAPPAPPSESRITQIRRVLQMADQILEQLEKHQQR
jgi:hypothetical protein